MTQEVSKLIAELQNEKETIQSQNDHINHIISEIFEAYPEIQAHVQEWLKHKQVKPDIKLAKVKKPE